MAGGDVLTPLLPARGRIRMHLGPDFFADVSSSRTRRRRTGGVTTCTDAVCATVALRKNGL